MITYSFTHETYYDRMAKELLEYGGYSDEIKSRLNMVCSYGYCANQEWADWCDALYQEYADRSLIE